MNQELIDHYKQFVDLTQLRENLKLTPGQRMEKFVRNMELVFELQKNAQRNREESKRLRQQKGSGAS